jgi:hypothetical protein
MKIPNPDINLIHQYHWPQPGRDYSWEIYTWCNSILLEVRDTIENVNYGSFILIDEHLFPRP